MRLPIIRLIPLILFVSTSSATTYAQQVKKSTFSRVQQLFSSAERLVKQSRYDSASVQLQEALQISVRANSKNTLVIAYDKLAELNQAIGKLDEMHKFDSLSLPILRQLKDTTLLVNLYNRAGILQMERGRNKEAEASFTTALNLGLAKQASKKTAEVHSNFGSLYLALGNKDKAMDSFVKALSLYEKNGYQAGMGETYSNIASLYYLMGKVDDAIQYQKSSLEIRQKLDDRHGLVITNVNIGQLYILKAVYPLAFSHLQQAVDLAEQLKKPKLLASAYSAMSAYCSRTKNYPEALIWQNKAIKLFEETKDKQMLSRLYVSAGNLANVANDSLTSISYYKSALALASELGNKENIGNAHDKMSAFYVARQDYEKAYVHYKKYITYRDSISEKSNLTKIAEIRTQYETEKKDNEITRLHTLQTLKELQIDKQNAVIEGNLLEAKQKQTEIEILSKEKQLQEEALEKQSLLTKNRDQQLALSKKEKQLKDNELLNQKLIRNLLIAGLALLVFSGFTFFNRFKLKRKIQQQADLLAIRNSISKNLHDEIGSTLTSINILSNVSQKAMLSQPEQVREMLGKIARQSKHVQETMSDIVWAIRPENEKIESLVARVREYVAHTLESQNIDTTITLNEDLLDKELSLQTRKELLLICKEAISNIAKHAGASEVSLLFKKLNNQLELRIADNGQWKGSSTGTGTKSMADRAKQIGGTLSIQPGKDGTLVLIQLPIT